MDERVPALDKAVAGEVWTSPVAYERLAQLCDTCGPRFAGTAGEQQAADLLMGWLRAAGLSDVHREPFPYVGWQRGSTRLEVIAPTQRPVAALALPYCPSGHIEAELCSVGEGEADDYAAAGAESGQLRGKMVLCAAESSSAPGRRTSHRRVKYSRAVDAGAVAFFYYNQNPGALAVTGSLASGKPAAIPGLGLAYEDGAMLLRLVQQGPVRMHLAVSAKFPEAESANVVADLPADPASPSRHELIVAGGHYDSHDISPGAVDNGSGTVIVLEAARALAAVHRAAGHGPQRRLRFCFFAAEEIGLLGSWNYVRRHADDLSQSRFMLNVDAVGRGQPGSESLTLVGCPDLAPYLSEQYEAAGARLKVRERSSTASDHFPFVVQGIPAGMLGSTEPPSAASGLVGRGWGHTIADTVDKARPESLQSAATFTARLLLRAANDPDWPGQQRSPQEVEAELEEAGHLAELRQVGRWPPPG